MASPSAVEGVEENRADLRLGPGPGPRPEGIHARASARVSTARTRPRSSFGLNGFRM